MMTYKDLDDLLLELENEDTEHQGQFSDLKYDRGGVRVWFSRVEPLITLEVCIGGVWRDAYKLEHWDYYADADYDDD